MNGRIVKIGRVKRADIPPGAQWSTNNNWLTNDPDAARDLRAADAAYDQAIFKSRDLPLAEKIVAIRTARANRLAAYRAVGQSTSW